MEAAQREALQRYLAGRFGGAARIEAVAALGEEGGEKGFGYGAPVRVTLAGAPVTDMVVRTVRAGGFGYDSLADRAAAVLLAYETFNNLPGHVRALDMGALLPGDERVSLCGVQEFFLITGYAEGEPYFRDLHRIRDAGSLSELDLRRVDRLAAYLAEIHAARENAPPLYVRRTRELFGHHECIAGLIDSYDAFPLEGFTSATELRDIERRCVEWRHRLKGFTHRLCRVHGDFHPWNVLWGPGDQLLLLDRSRGEWGEAADDVSWMAINYLFFGLQAEARPAGQVRESRAPAAPFEEMWTRFFEGYLSATSDEELPRVIAPYFVWRALVVASPLWYPDLDVRVRQRLFRFIDRVLGVEAFDWREVGELLGRAV
jgi:hypothetical protein